MSPRTPHCWRLRIPDFRRPSSAQASPVAQRCRGSHAFLTKRSGRSTCSTTSENTASPPFEDVPVFAIGGTLQRSSLVKSASPTSSAARRERFTPLPVSSPMTRGLRKHILHGQSELAPLASDVEDHRSGSGAGSGQRAADSPFPVVMGGIILGRVTARGPVIVPIVAMSLGLSTASVHGATANDSLC